MRSFTRTRKLNWFTAVDEPVVIRKGQIHHRPEDHLIVDSDRTLFNSVHAEDGRTAAD